MTAPRYDVSLRRDIPRANRRTATPPTARRGVRRFAALAGVALIAGLALAPSLAQADRAWTAGVRGGLLAEGTTESFHRGWEGSAFAERGGDREVTFGLEAGYLRDPGGRSSPHDEITLAYAAPRALFRLSTAVVPAFVQVGVLGGQYDRTAATPEHRDGSGFVMGGFVGAVARYEVRPFVGLQFDGRFTRAFGSSLPEGEDAVDWWSVGFAVLTWR